MPNACHVELAVETRKCQIQQNQVMPYPNRNSQPYAKQCFMYRIPCIQLNRKIWRQFTKSKVILQAFLDFCGFDCLDFLI